MLYLSVRCSRPCIPLVLDLAVTMFLNNCWKWRYTTITPPIFNHCMKTKISRVLLTIPIWNHSICFCIILVLEFIKLLHYYLVLNQYPFCFWFQDRNLNLKNHILLGYVLQFALEYCSTEMPFEETVCRWRDRHFKTWNNTYTKRYVFNKSVLVQHAIHMSW